MIKKYHNFQLLFSETIKILTRTQFHTHTHTKRNPQSYFMRLADGILNDN